jgi:hypothetical protein
LFKKRSILDRRSENDRRRVYSLDLFLQGRVERWTGAERCNQRQERRSGWVNVNGWSSVSGDI